MRRYQLHAFGLEHLKIEQIPDPQPGPGQVLFAPRAQSLNYRDLLIVKGLYNRKLRLPAVPLSDAAGVVLDVGPGVTGFEIGDHVMTNVVVDWLAGPLKSEYLKSMLGTPGPGLAAERVVLPAAALLPVPVSYNFEQAATLPIAALTAWSALVTAGGLQPGQTVLTLGAGGVSIFALQLAKALGARVIITSSSDEKLARAAQLGADFGINYRSHPAWERRVLEWTDGLGVDLVVENVGAATLDQSLTATRTSGAVALLGALAGLSATINTGQVLMRRLRICGVMVDSRAAFCALSEFLNQHPIAPVLDRRFPFEELPAALRYMESGAHFGKIVIDM